MVRYFYGTVAVWSVFTAIPAVAQTSPQSLRLTVAQSAPDPQIQSQISELQDQVSSLSQRLEAAQATSAAAPPMLGAPNRPASPRYEGEAACGSVCNYYRNFDWSKDAYISVGAGLRTSYLAAEDMAANGSSYSNDWVLDSTRLYFNGRGHKYIGFEVNTDIQNTYLRPFVTDNDAVKFRLLDAIGKFGDGGAVNAWVGRMLPPSDRANLSGPFFTNTYDFPFVSNLPAIFDGRQDGAVVWGIVGNQALKYQAGIYDGANSIVGGANPTDAPQFNGRLVYNFLDPELGYYNQSTYYGQKHVLAAGISVVHQNRGIFSATDGASNFNSWTADLLYDTPLNNGAVFTFNSAYYDYNTGVRTDNLNANAIDGSSGLLEAGYMSANELRVGKMVGRLRPVIRWQEYHRSFAQAAAAAGAIERGRDIELQYVINGSNARLSAGWGQRDLANGRNNIDVFLLGTQLQF